MLPILHGASPFAAPNAPFIPREIGFSSSLAAVGRRTESVVAADAFSLRFKQPPDEVPSVRSGSGMLRVTAQ